jgi:hypothetical protein
MPVDVPHAGAAAVGNSAQRAPAGAPEREPDMPDGSALVLYRPTWRQAVGGSVVPALALLVAATLVQSLVEHLRGHRWPAVHWIAVAAALAVMAVVALLTRRRGVAATEAGLRAVGPRRPRQATWQQVVDVRTERRGNRGVVLVDLDTGRVWRLAAPYDGPVLDRDPEFEEKLFTLRDLWETYRTRLPEFPDAAGGPGWDGAAG